jgi:CheY-like chemotaxis protein
MPVDARGVQTSEAVTAAPTDERGPASRARRMAVKPQPLIYCYDDDAIMRRVLSRIFRALTPGEVVMFDDAEAAVAQAIAIPPDLFTTDLRHPGPSGEEMVRALRRSASGRNVPVWIISGQAEPCRKAALDAGANLVFDKPLRSDELVDHMQRLFGGPRKEPLDLDAEAPDLDIKERPSLSTRDGQARLAKDVIAMANFGGGHIVFGKRDDGKGGFDWVGLSDEDLAELEVSRLNRALATFTDPAHHVVPRACTRAGLRFVELQVPAGEQLIMAARQNDNAKLYLGRIYTRTAAVESAEAQTSHDVRTIVDRLHAVHSARDRRKS